MSVSVNESAFGFVDDTTCQTNDFLESEPKSLPSLVTEATSDAKIWSTLLYISGGLLELPKCSVHVVHTHFYPSGQPKLSKATEIPPIFIPDPRTGQNIEIQCNPLDREHKTLGHYKAPSGIFPKQRAALKKASDDLASMILKSHLHPQEASMVYYAIFLAKFAYVLPQCYISKNILRQTEANAQQSFAAKMGFNRKMACAIRYGPTTLGGVGMVRFETLQGVAGANPELRETLEVLHVYWITPSLCSRLGPNERGHKYSDTYDTISAPHPLRIKVPTKPPRLPCRH
eukprot:scaffold11426_cov78-Cylindrotheca_fusiformis.AAC.2